MDSRARWLPHPHATYHFWYPDDRREVLAGDAVEPALVAAPAGTRVWMQGTSGWVDSRSTTLRGRWRLEAVDPTPEMVWMSEYAAAGRVSAAWNVNSMEDQCPSLTAAMRYGTWLPGESANAKGVVATSPDVARWLGLLETDSTFDTLAAAELLAAVLQFEPALMPEWGVSRMVGLLNVPDRRVVGAVARALLVFWNTESLECHTEIQHQFIGSGGIEACTTALNNPPDEAFGLACTLMAVTSGADHLTPDGYLRVLDALEGDCYGATLGALWMLAGTDATTKFRISAGARPSIALGKMTTHRSGSMRFMVFAAAGRLYHDADSAPDWLLGALLSTVAIRPFSYWAWFQMRAVVSLDSPWLDAKVAFWRQAGMVEQLLSYITGYDQPEPYLGTLIRVLRAPEGVTLFLKGAGPQRIRAWAERNPSSPLPLKLMADIFHESTLAEVGSERVGLGKRLAREFCWQVVVSQIREMESSTNFDADFLSSAVSAIEKMSLVATSELRAHHSTEMQACIDFVGCWVGLTERPAHPGSDVVLENCLHLLANLACEPVLRPSVAKFLPRLRELGRHTDTDVRAAAMRAVANCT